jgi:hypothetical protein
MTTETKENKTQVIEVEVLIYVEDAKSAHVHRCSGETTYAVLFERLRDGGLLLEKMIVYEENEDEPVDRGHPVGHHGHHRRILHAHRCKHIDVTVVYLQPLKHEFRPGKTIHAVLDWALDHIPGIDKNKKWCLRLDNAEGTKPAGDTHIGKLAVHSKCSLELYLTEDVKPKG